MTAGAWLARFRGDKTPPCDIRDKRGQNLVLSGSVTNVTGDGFVTGEKGETHLEVARLLVAGRCAVESPDALADPAELVARGEADG